MYAYRNRQFNATVTFRSSRADPETQRYTVLLDLENPPENLLAGMTGEMNIITASMPRRFSFQRAPAVDQVWQVRHGVWKKRTVKGRYRTLDFLKCSNGLREGDGGGRGPG